ncbi:MAG: iron ABC transporter permease [bacterium]|nr:iron ABC transporter permease [bacterium]
MRKILYKILFSVSFLFLIFFYLGFNADLSSPDVRNMILYIRLPRLILALLTGAGLSLSGAVMQTLFRNPLADPYMLGISGGALFGAMLSKLIFGGSIIISVLFSFIFACAAFFSSLILARTIKGDRRFTLIMSGLILNILFSSLVVILSIMMKNDAKNLFYMLMGSLNFIMIKNHSSVYFFSILLLLSAFAFSLFKSRELDLMSFGDENAYSSGIDAGKTFFVMMLVSVLIVSVLVSFSGIIGFVGVLIPNMARISGSRKHMRLLLDSLLYGSFALLISDFVAKNLMDFELPVGVVTSIVGIPFLYFVMKRNSNASD